MSSPRPSHKSITAHRPLLGLCACGCILQGQVLSQTAAPAEHSSLAELENLSISTVSNRPQRLADAAAAIHVVSDEDILRSGASSIAEALRYVPGLKVAQINGYTWAIGSRSYQWQNASKLLVMIDGRSVYSPIFGGVHWDVQDTLLEDIDRIEVVNGPGGSVWGANAFNGVINVLTKDADRTLGTLISVGAGTLEHASFSVRHGWRINDETCARVYSKLGATGSLNRKDGSPGDDAVRRAQFGFRVDGNGLAGWTVQGDAYALVHDTRVELPQLYPATNYIRTFDRDARASGANLKALWESHSSAGTLTRLQLWYDYTHREDYSYDGDVHTLDATYAGSHQFGELHRLDWGLGARWINDSFRKGWVQFPEPRQSTCLYSLHLQDDLSLLQGKIALTSGIKLEHSGPTGWEPQPNLRLLYHAGLKHTVWAAASHSVRTPTRYETSGDVDARVYPPGTAHPSLPLAVRLFGNPFLHSEELNAFEVGWRWQPNAQFSISLSGFSYDYSELLFATTETPYVQTAPVTALIQPARFENGLSGECYGGELVAQWQPRERLRLRLAYSLARTQLHTTKPDPFEYERDEVTTPRNTVSLQVLHSLGKDWDLDTSVRYIDTVAYYQIPAYFSADLRLAWHPTPSFEAALIGSDLLAPSHPEYRPAVVNQSMRLPRSGEVRLTWHY